jgi:DNA-binding transcriptional regulator YiaG
MSGGLIRRLRHRLGITQMQLSHLLGVARGTVALWETDKIRPTGKNRAALVGLRRVGRRDVAKMLDARRAAKSG